MYVLKNPGHISDAIWNHPLTTIPQALLSNTSNKFVPLEENLGKESHDIPSFNAATISLKNNWSRKRLIKPEFFVS